MTRSFYLELWSFVKALFLINVYETIIALSWHEKWTTRPLGNLTKVPWFRNFLRQTGHESMSVKTTFCDSTEILSSWTWRNWECIRPLKSWLWCRCETLFSIEDSRNWQNDSRRTEAGVQSKTVIRSIWNKKYLKFHLKQKWCVENARKFTFSQELKWNNFNFNRVRSY